MLKVAIVICTVVVCAAATQDELALKDGRFVQGVKISEVKDGYKIHYENGEVFVPADLVKDAYLTSDGGYQPKNDKEREKLEKGYAAFVKKGK